MAAAQEDVIAAAADAYLNNPDTVFNISSEGLMEQLLGDNLPLVISLRPAESFALGHVTGAVNMPFGTLFESENLSALPNDNKIIVTCYTGHTASQATALLNLCGYDTTNLKWGIMGWTKDTTVATKQFANPDSDLPVETTANEATATYERPTVDVTSSSVDSEIIKAACNAYASAGEKNLEKLNPDKQIVVYCYTGRDASQATAILNILGYDASNLLWGMTGWTTDPEIAPKRFDPAGIPDYPFEVGE
jgi:rhodanese-related sulfurtransferase